MSDDPKPHKFKHAEFADKKEILVYCEYCGVISYDSSVESKGEVKYRESGPCGLSPPYKLANY